MIKALIENYETLTIVGVFGIMMAWYLWHQTRATTEREKKHDEEKLKRETKRDEERKEEMLFNRNLLINDIKSIHAISLENSKLNSQGLILQKGMIKDQKDHNKDSHKAWKKVNESLSAVCDKLNGRGK
ncbi:hypothetical protein ES708_26259 [subsurface metagenome]